MIRLGLGLALVLVACQSPPAPPVSPPAPPSTTTPAPIKKAAAPAPPAAFRPPEGATKWKRVIMTEWRYAFGLNAEASVAFAQIHQESRFREDARSQAGALGMAQFMPTTAAGYQQNLSRLQEVCASKGGCPLEPRWAIRALTAYDHDEWTWASFAPSERERWAHALASYNGGRGWLMKERHACADKPGCEPPRWFGHVERVCVRADWACRESREYPRVILEVHQPKYRAWLGGG